MVNRLARLRQPDEPVAISDLARTECLAHPYMRRDFAMVADYQAFFGNDDVLMLPVTASVCERAARIRAATAFSLKVPDCLHLAAAMEAGCRLFLTNDQQLRDFFGIHVEILT